MHDFVFKHQYLRVEFWVSLASSHLLIWGQFLPDRFATLWLYLLIPIVMLCSTFRQLVASLQVGPMWSCWQWEPQPQMLPSSALWSGALLKYHKVSSYPWPGSLLSSKGYWSWLFIPIFSALCSFSLRWLHTPFAQGPIFTSIILERSPKTLRLNRCLSRLP